MLLEPVRPLVLAVGRLLVEGLEAVVGRAVVPSVRPELLFAVTRPDLALFDAVGRAPLIEPEVVRPDTEAPFCEVWLLLAAGRLIEPVVPLLP